MITEEFQHLFNINSIISYMETTDAGRWTSDVCRTQDGKNCFLGHLYEYAGGDENNKVANGIIDWFESAYATTYMFFPINDGKHPDYPQKTQKDRIIAYLKNLRDGKEQTTCQIMEEFDVTRKSNR